ncbi:hypothetical protein M8332_07120 (plasmid) [Fructilactobacillus ixorae]|uniref:LITAF domain-containing protein n=1 Tax=Fructilactobacillus ixorae TaxID=1750535 RepID=A0ABY5C5Z9_9LACO|nr:hypothetical protein [Fructilactobacillus ixorae]USS93987.1 hypothetical protein M8332_07120 [Fructilactobacillus ixorae]
MTKESVECKYCHEPFSKARDTEDIKNFFRLGFNPNPIIFFWCPSTAGVMEIEINYCPMCGKELNNG